MADDWRGRGGGRKGPQPTISGRGSWKGAGKGRGGTRMLGGLIPAPDAIASNPIAFKLANMAAYELRSHIEGLLGRWTGRGKGRMPGQPTLKAPSVLGVARGQEANFGNDHILDPQGAYIFCLEIDKKEVAHFLECSGLKSSTTIFELEEGGMNHRVHKLPGQSRWENITLRYGVTGDATMLQWRGDILQDKFKADSRKNGAIVMKNNNMQVVRRYNFKAAWPVSWEGPSFNAQSNELAIESVELAHDGIEVQVIQ
jgi:phage tail-like protein